MKSILKKAESDASTGCVVLSKKVQTVFSVCCIGTYTLQNANKWYNSILGALIL